MYYGFILFLLLTPRASVLESGFRSTNACPMDIDVCVVADVTLDNGHRAYVVADHRQEALERAWVIAKDHWTTWDRHDELPCREIILEPATRFLTPKELVCGRRGLGFAMQLVYQTCQDRPQLPKGTKMSDRRREVAGRFVFDFPYAFESSWMPMVESAAMLEAQDAETLSFLTELEYVANNPSLRPNPPLQTDGAGPYWWFK